MTSRLKGGVRQSRETPIASEDKPATPRLKGGVRQEREQAAASSSGAEAAPSKRTAELDTEESQKKKEN